MQPSLLLVSKTLSMQAIKSNNITYATKYDSMAHTRRPQNQLIVTISPAQTESISSKHNGNLGLFFSV